MNVTTANSLFNVNRTLDNVPKASSDTLGSGQVENPEMASGRPVNPAIADTAVDRTADAAATKVVNQANEVLGNLIDTRA